MTGVHDVTDCLGGRSRAGRGIVADDHDVIGFGGVFGVISLNGFRGLGQINHVGDISDDKEEETEGGDADFGKDDDQPINREVDPFVAIAAKQEAEEGDGSLEIHAFESRQIVREEDEHREAREAEPGKKEEEGDDKAAGALIHADNDDVDDE